MNEVDEEKLQKLNEFAAKFRELKQSLINMNLASQENVRLAIERLDDGFLRAREAIFAVPYNVPDQSPEDKVPEEKPQLSAVH